jgi:hypothetical protein
MAQVRFHPHFDTTLTKVLASALQNGTVAVTCSGLDAAVLAAQVARYATARGATVRCEIGRDKVTVHGEGRAKHPTAARKPATSPNRSA